MMDNKAYGPHRLHWRTLCFATAEGVDSFDFIPDPHTAISFADIVSWAPVANAIEDRYATDFASQALPPGAINWTGWKAGARACY